MRAHPLLGAPAIPIATEGTIVSDMVLHHEWAEVQYGFLTAHEGVLLPRGRR